MTISLSRRTLFYYIDWLVCRHVIWIWASSGHSGCILFMVSLSLSRKMSG